MIWGVIQWYLQRYFLFAVVIGIIFFFLFLGGAILVIIGLVAKKIPAVENSKRGKRSSRAWMSMRFIPNQA